MNASLHYKLRRAVNQGDVDEVRALLKAGAAVMEPSTMLMPVLSLAADNGAADIVELLLEHGADARRTTDDGWSAATYADAAEFDALAARLVEAGAPESSRTAHGYTALHRAARRGDVARFLPSPDLDALDACGATPLALAIAHRQEAAAEALLRAGANTNHGSLLSDAAYQDSRPWEPTHFVTLLLAAGAEPMREGAYPLFLTANQEWSSPSVLRQLVAAGIEINGRVEAGQTVLHRIAQISGDEMVDAAVDAGADLEAKDADGRTPVMLAERNENKRSYARLVARGAKLP